MRAILPYHLGPGGISQFYPQLFRFTNDVWLVARLHLGQHADQFYGHIKNEKSEVLRTADDYLLELVITGTLLENYYAKAQARPPWSFGLLMGLYRARKRYKKLKNRIDRLRGILSFWLLEGRSWDTGNWTLHGFQRLLNWLEATGEFSEEVRRLRQWMPYYRQRSAADFRSIIKSAVFVARYMNTKGEEELGAYTCKVPQFLSVQSASYRYREDYFFVTRARNEYYMNLFGAELMNRGMRNHFRSMPR